MQFEVTFRNLQPRDEIRQRGAALFRKLERFLDPAAEGHLVVDVEHHEAVLDIVVTTRGQTFKAHEEDAELRTALDRLFHNVENQLRRAKGRRGERRSTPRTSGFGEEVAEEEEGEAEAL